MRTLLTILILSISGQAFTQTLTPESAKIKAAFIKLTSDTNKRQFQADYVSVFPADSRVFLSVFHSPTFDQLYSDSDDYIFVLEKCATNFPKEVIGKCVDISKNMTWDADATGYMQHLSVRLSSKFNDVFVGKFNALTRPEQDALFKFYADAENHRLYHDYQALIDKLKSVGQQDLANRLEIARTVRQKSHDH